MPMCDDLQNFIRTHLTDYDVGGGTWAAPTGLFLRLFTADPTSDPDSFIGTREVAGGSYTGQALTWTHLASAGAAETMDDVLFTNMPAVTVTHAAIAEDASGASSWFYYGPLVASKIIAAGDAARVAAGDLDFDND